MTPELSDFLAPGVAADDVPELATLAPARPLIDSFITLFRGSEAEVLLVVIWSLIVLPKRECQVTRRELADDGQGDIFGADKPVAHGETGDEDEAS